MPKKLCTVWAELVSDPGNRAVVAEARSRLAGLLDHVDDCDACRRASDGMQDPHAVLAALSEGGVKLSEEDRAIVRSMDEALASNEAAVRHAVEEVLLPGLPDPLGNLEAISPGLTGLQLFLAIDAINLLVCSYASRQPGQAIVLSELRGLRLGGKTVAGQRALIAEAAEHARVGPEAAERVWRWQFSVAGHCPRLYAGLTVRQMGRGAFLLTLDEPSLKVDLVERWSPLAAATDHHEAMPALDERHVLEKEPRQELTWQQAGRVQREREKASG